MVDHLPDRARLARERIRHRNTKSLLRGGLIGMALVTAATLGLTVLAALIAVLVITLT